MKLDEVIQMKFALRLTFRWLAVLAVAAAWACPAAAQPARRPHIVYIVSDDQGW